MTISGISTLKPKKDLFNIPQIYIVWFELEVGMCCENWVEKEVGLIIICTVRKGRATWTINGGR